MSYCASILSTCKTTRFSTPSRGVSGTALYARCLTAASPPHWEPSTESSSYTSTVVSLSVMSTVIMSSNAFALRSSLWLSAMDVVPANSHVGGIERSNRTLKERTRTCVHGLPFKRLAKLMVIHIVKDAVHCLNQFPWSHGISNTMSPDTIITGAPPPDFNKMRLEFKFLRTMSPPILYAHAALVLLLSPPLETLAETTTSCPSPPAP